MTRPKKPKLSGPGAKDYEVGYGRPPAETQFKPGQSGNPRGRPKGRHKPVQTPFNEPFEDLVLAEAYRNIPVNDGAKQKKMPMLQPIFRAAAVSAAKGNTRAQKQFADLVSVAEAKKREKLTEEMKGAMEMKVRLEKELERRQNNNIPTDDLLPHPDDIIIDMSTGQVNIWGPTTKEELRDLKNLLTGLRMQGEINDELMGKMKAASNRTERAKMIEQLRAPLRNQFEIEAEIRLRASPQCVRRILQEKE